MEFTASQITQVTGVKRTRLQQWLEKEYLKPSVQQASGPGTRNIYSLIDLYCIAIFKNITESGLSRKLVADMLQETLLGDVVEESDVMDIKDIVYMRVGKSVEATAIVERELGFKILATTPPIEKYDNMFVINFEKLRKEIDKKIKFLNG